jgi:hypothetical protein
MVGLAASKPCSRQVILPQVFHYSKENELTHRRKGIHIYYVTERENYNSGENLKTVIYIGPAGRVVHVVECLPCNCEALTSPITKRGGVVQGVGPDFKPQHCKKKKKRKWERLARGTVCLACTKELGSIPSTKKRKKGWRCSSTWLDQSTLFACIEIPQLNSFVQLIYA